MTLGGSEHLLAVARNRPRLQIEWGARVAGDAVDAVGGAVGIRDELAASPVVSAATISDAGLAGAAVALWRRTAGDEFGAEDFRQVRTGNAERGAAVVPNAARREQHDCEQFAHATTLLHAVSLLVEHRLSGGGR